MSVQAHSFMVWLVLLTSQVVVVFLGVFFYLEADWSGLQVNRKPVDLVEIQ